MIFIPHPTAPEPSRVRFIDRLPRKGDHRMTLTGVIDDHMLHHYRELLDQEDAAFDELEHAYEDGDRDHFEADFSMWTRAARKRLAYLRRMGVDLDIT